MLKTYVVIDLYNKITNTYDKTIKDRLFSGDLIKILNNLVTLELDNYRVENNKCELYSKNQSKGLILSSDYYFNSFDYSHGYIFFNDKNNNISIEELEFFSNKLKIYFEKYLNYKIMNPIISESNRL